MISQRIRGIQSLLVLAQCVLASALYWIWFLWLWHFYSELSSAFTERYLLYWAAAMAGLVLEVVTRDRMRFRHTVVQADFGRQHRIALRQTLIATTAMLLFIAFRKDTYISRVFLGAFAPSLYMLLLLTNRYLAPLLSRRSFRGLREEKTILIGSSRKAIALKEWLDRKSAVGFQTVGLLCDERIPNAALDIPILGHSDAVGPHPARLQNPPGHRAGAALDHGMALAPSLGLRGARGARADCQRSRGEAEPPRDSFHG